MTVPETPLEHTEHGLLLAGDGWFVLNAREAMWRSERIGKWPRLEGATPRFAQVGLGLRVLEPGQPMTMYHWETDEENFLVLSGEALAIVEGHERPLRTWDFLHCPPGTNHAIVGAGAGPCVILAVGARERHTYRKADGSIDGRDDWGAYTVDETALRHGAGVEEEMADDTDAYPLGEPTLTSYEEGWLP